MNHTLQCDVLVVGGGMVGGTVAALLARCGFAVAVVEPSVPEPFHPDLEYGLRVSALSPGSADILSEAGAWAEITRQRHCPYRRMVVEDGAHAEKVTFEAPAFGLDWLGSIVENDLVQHALWRALQGHAMVEVFSPGRLESFADGATQITGILADGTRIEADLLVACDGSSSRVRRLLGGREDIWEYNQKAVVCVVAKAEPNPGTAWQRFLADGPLAFLPLTDGRSSIVWTLPAGAADRLIAATDEEFAERLAQASHGWLGGVKAVGPRTGFPLAMRLSRRYVAGRTVLLGDAAHSIHPLAGQGVNLGFADAAALVETLVANRRSGRELAEPGRLRAFERWRRSETTVMAQGVHLLGGLFGSRPLAGLRRLGMSAVGRSWMIREAFLRRAAGLGPNAPRLSRGQTLRSLLTET